MTCFLTFFEGAKSWRNLWRQSWVTVQDIQKSLWELWDVYYHLSFYETWQNVFIRTDRAAAAAAAAPWWEAWYLEGDNIFSVLLYSRRCSFFFLNPLIEHLHAKPSFTMLLELLKSIIKIEENYSRKGRILKKKTLPKCLFENSEPTFLIVHQLLHLT